MNSKLVKLKDYRYYCPKFFKIKTKLDGIRPLILRKYQKKFIDFYDNISGPKRIIVVKPRQCGFSTLTSSIFSHKVFTEKLYKVLAMADQSKRTDAITDIYSTFLNQLPYALRPSIDKDNTEKITLKRSMSEIAFATALDPNAGKSEARKGAHLSENAFYRYYKEIDESVQNSIPLHDSTCIIKESTANGRAGIGRPFYLLYQAAKRGESIYKSFFVAWYEVDDYHLPVPDDFRPGKEEVEILKQYPDVTESNLMWRRLKILEYLDDEEDTMLTPEERFLQDFPLSDDSAFLHSGSPVFDSQMLGKIINELNRNKINDIKDKLNIQSCILKDYWQGLKIYSPPREGKDYYIGADCAEGLAQGDSSSCFIMDESYNQVARWHGKIDPDLYGHLLIALGDLYNEALLCVENNNMGHTTITTIKNEGYSRQYKKVTEDKIKKQTSIKYGWTTTGPSKNDMLNETIRRLRDGDIRILDIRLPEQMGDVTRGENGVVDLNGKDRVVACCLAVIARKHHQPFQSSKPARYNKEIYDTGMFKKKKRGGDMYD